MRSHKSMEHYKPQYILNVVIVYIGSTDLDPASNRREIPKVMAARYCIPLDNGLVQPWNG